LSRDKSDSRHANPGAIRRDLISTLLAHAVVGCEFTIDKICYQE